MTFQRATVHLVRTTTTCPSSEGSLAPVQNISNVKNLCRAVPRAAMIDAQRAQPLPASQYGQSWRRREEEEVNDDGEDEENKENDEEEGAKEE